MKSPSQSLSRILWWAYILFILGATQYPFVYHPTAEYMRLRIPSINWFPLVTVPGHTLTLREWVDFFVNVGLFFPFGFLGYFALKGESSKWKVIRLVVFGFFFSTGIEFAQLFTEVRYTTLTDVIMDTAGSGMGAVFAVFLRFIPL